ncbi:MAG: major outer membrane protein [Campylobacter sp.]|nr:major outer membrane protein [Campylobacter sp.]
MKFFKLSLVAAMAAGALATSASAVALEEAIKDVDISGLAFIRYQSNKDDSKSSSSTWQFRSVVNLKTTIDDNFFFLAGIRYGVDTPDVDSGSHLSTSVGGNTDKKFMLNQILLGWTPGADTTIMAGRYVLGTFFTDDMYGDGIKIVNTGIEGMTLAALWADALEKDGDIGTLALTDDITNHNLYGVAAIGSYDPISFQMWYAYLQDVAGLFAVEAALDFGVSDDVSFGIKGQYAFADIDEDVKALGVDDSKFAAGEASLNVFGFDASAGYVYYKAKNNAASLTSFEDQGSFIAAGEILEDYSAYKGKNNYFFVTAGYTIPNTGLRIGADYLNGKFTDMDSGDRFKAQEYVGRIEYDYNSKLNFTAWYAHADYKPSDMVDEDAMRIQATYKF